MSDVQKASQLGEEFAQRFNSEGVSPFPFNKIRESYPDLNIYLVDFSATPAVSGVIMFNKDTKKFDILINKDKPEVRRNFTIAHELGHYFLHQEHIMQKGLVVDKGSSLDAEGAMMFQLEIEIPTAMEKEANNFASSLLMPTNLVRKAWTASHSIEDCAKLFSVSAVAMSIRLDNLGLVTSS